MIEGLNNDFSRKVVMRTAEMPWQESPSRGVWRKRLDLAGDSEKSRVTSVVRYDPGSRFTSHPHPDGEEIFVLDGVFSDESGDYGRGSFLLNPEGFSHAPFSREGCELFVKLRQYPGYGRRHVVIDSATASWEPGEVAGAQVMTLYAEEGYPETIELHRLEEGCELPTWTHFGGAELFVVEGSVKDEEGYCDAGDWVRYPAGTIHRLSSDKGALIYLKRGHLA